MSDDKKSVASLKTLLEKFRHLQSASVNDDISNIIHSTAWLLYKTSKGTVCYDPSKLTMQRADFQKELKHASVFASLGCKVYLLKENHTIQGLKSVDALIDGVLVELKYIEGTRATAGRAYGNGLSQSKNVAMFISSKAPDTQDGYLSKLHGTAKASSHTKGLLVVYFENGNKLVVKDMSGYN